MHDKIAGPKSSDKISRGMRSYEDLIIRKNLSWDLKVSSFEYISKVIAFKDLNNLVEIFERSKKI